MLQDQTALNETVVSADQTADHAIATLGKDIVARIEAGDKAKSKSDEYFKSAGLQLIEAQNRVQNFRASLKEHCNNLSKTRAYELIKIAGGKGEEVRAETRARTARHRAKAAQAKTATVQAAKAETATVQANATVSATQRTHPSDWQLAQFKGAVDEYLPKMNAEDKQQALAYVSARVKS